MSFLLKVVSTGLSFLIAVVLARALGAEGYGIYAYAYAIAAVLALPAQAGLPHLVVRETARSMAQCQPDRVQGVWRWASRVAVLMSLVLVMLAAAALIFWRRGNMSVREQTVAWALALVPLLAVGNLRGAALRGLKRIVAGDVPEFLIRPGIFLLLAVGLAVAGGGRLTASAAMALHVIAACIAFAVGAWLLWKETPPAVRRARPHFDGRAWLSSTILLACVAGMEVINNQADILILGLFHPADEVGSYRVAVQLATVASFGLQALNTVVAPQFAQLYIEKEMVRLQQLVTASARIGFAFNVVATVCFVLMGRPTLKWVFGSDFVAAYVPLLILLVGQLVNSALGSVVTLLNMTGHERETARGIAVATLGNGVLNLVLIPPFGAVGAALASTVTLSTWNALLWRTVHKRLGINSMAFRSARLSMKT